jgi:osmoprotectant transport system substrate-binding protein
MNRKIRWMPGILLALLACSCTIEVGSVAPAINVNHPIAPRDPDQIIVGAYNFTESAVLAHIYAEVLRDQGVDVVVMQGISSREVMEPALEQGFVDLVPEYQGTLFRYLTGSTQQASSPYSLYRDLTRAAAERRLSVLAFADAQNQNAFVVRRDLAERFGLTKVSDLYTISPELVFGGPPECPSRPFCLLGLGSLYGVEFGSFASLDAGGPLTLNALIGREIDVGLMFSSDPSIRANDLVILKDDKHLQPPENVVPVLGERVGDIVTDEVLTRLSNVNSELTTQDLIEMNRKVDIHGWEPVDAAKQWLKTSEKAA